MPFENLNTDLIAQIYVMLGIAGPMISLGVQMQFFWGLISSSGSQRPVTLVHFGSIMYPTKYVAEMNEVKLSKAEMHVVLLTGDDGLCDSEVSVMAKGEWLQA